MAKQYAIWLGYDKKHKAVYFNGFNPDGTFEKETIDEKNGELPSFTCGKTVAKRIERMLGVAFTYTWDNKPKVDEVKDYSYLYKDHK